MWRRRQGALTVPWWGSEHDGCPRRKPTEPDMRSLFLLVPGVLLAAAAASAVQPFPASFRTQKIDTNGTKYYVRTGGTGPAVLLVHGFADTGDMWAPIAARLAKDHTVIVPDLRAGHAVGGNRCAAARHRRLGEHHQEPVAVAFQLPRTGR